MNKAAVRASVSADAFGHDETQNDYLAEWSVRTSSPCGSKGAVEVSTSIVPEKTKPPDIGACHASRIVDGGVDSQA